MSGGLVFSQIPLQFLSQICQQNIHRLTDDSLSSDSRDQQPKLTLFHFAVRRKNTRGWGWKYNFRLEISVVCPIYRGLSFSCHCTKIVTLDNVSQSTKVRVKETSKSLWLQTLWWAPLQTYFLQKFSCNSYIILQQTNKTFTAFANYFSKPDIFTDCSRALLSSL